MALQQCGLNLNRVKKELRPHGSLDFPCGGYASRHTECPEDIIPWHWHEEIEIIYIENGKMKIRTPSKKFLLKQGDCIAINSNMLHYAAADGTCMLHSFVFQPLLITGSPDSVFSKKYIQPLLSCGAFSGYQIEPEDREQVAGWFCTAFHALVQEDFGYEFIVRENLTRICLLLYKVFEERMDVGDQNMDQDGIRIRKMLEYIHKNFAGDISLTEIAATAGISERECLRCFKKTIQISPIQYLMKYRIMQGADMLLRNPASNITEISSGCGFDSPSNFSKVFKRFYKCTPREYRKREVDNETRN